MYTALSTGTECSCPEITWQQKQGKGVATMLDAGLA